jgi:hypothetical protein
MEFEEDVGMVHLGSGFHFYGEKSKHINDTYIAYKVTHKKVADDDDHNHHHRWFLYKFAYALNSEVHVYAPYVGNMPEYMKAIFPYADIWKTRSQLIMTKSSNHDQIIVKFNPELLLNPNPHQMTNAA